MPDWGLNYSELEKRGILNPRDYSEMVKRWGIWATNLAIAQEKPESTSRERIFERAQRLRKSVDPFFNSKT